MGLQFSLIAESKRMTFWLWININFTAVVEVFLDRHSFVDVFESHDGNSNFKGLRAVIGGLESIHGLAVYSNKHVSSSFTVKDDCEYKPCLC